MLPQRGLKQSSSRQTDSSTVRLVLWMTFLTLSDVERCAQFAAGRAESGCEILFFLLCQEIGWEERLRNNLFCIEWDVKP